MIKRTKDENHTDEGNCIRHSWLCNELLECAGREAATQHHPGRCRKESPDPGPMKGETCPKTTCPMTAELPEPANKSAENSPPPRPLHTHPGVTASVSQVASLQRALLPMPGHKLSMPISHRVNKRGHPTPAFISER